MNGGSDVGRMFVKYALNHNKHFTNVKYIFFYVLIICK